MRCAALLALAVLVSMSSPTRAEEPSGYWLYVGGVWKAGFVPRAECEAARARTGVSYECRAVIIGGRSSATPTIRDPAHGSDVLGAKDPDDQWVSDVKACSRTTGVEAVVYGPGRVEYIGQPHEKLEFTKCLVKRGHQMR